MIDWLSEVSSKLLQGLDSILPKSPFSGVIDAIQSVPCLSYIAWFVPIGWILNLLCAWIVAIGTYYFVMIVLRWIKAID